jgi:hypothetical protein
MGASRPPLAALHDYKALAPLSLSRLHCRHSQRPHLFYRAVSLPLRPLDSVLGSNALARTTCCALSPSSEPLHDDLSPLLILPQSTLLRWPSALIGPFLHHTFLVGGLALTMTSMTGLVVSGAELAAGRNRQKSMTITLGSTW